MFKITNDYSVETRNFWNSVFLYYSSPHLINRRILSVSPLCLLKIQFKHEIFKVRDILKYSVLDSKINNLQSINSKYIDSTTVSKLFEKYGNCFSHSEANLDELKLSADEVFVSVRILYPRNFKTDKCVEFVIIDKQNTSASFLAVSKSSIHALSPPFHYDIVLDSSNLMKINISDAEKVQHKACDWLTTVLFPKLISWTKIRDDLPFKTSLSLVQAEDYCNLYHELKIKYGESITKTWPENTDPLKFVYEDVAIATYLLLIWKKYSNEQQKFVDLGCGNGLLVHILSQEGHNGYGIDIRPRKIWSMFPETTQLKVETIVPSSKYLFPEADWLIGNHSDELTPWIPVIAARSSAKCNFFLLPCCSYEFNGSKYQRSNSSISQYQEYMDYVKGISEICGFSTEVDRLRIPSTKRICFVGTRRDHDMQVVEMKITNFIDIRCGLDNKSHTNWVDNFVARPQAETVRNCTKLDKTLIGNIVKKVATHLLATTNYIKDESGKKWNTGTSVHLSELVKLVSADQLKQLKKECGGLQTLLKNHHYVFVVSNGTVKLRIPTHLSMKKNVKKTDCWFHKNHPDGCPLSAQDCSYIHHC